MAKISNFINEIKLSLNIIQREIFDILDVHKQTVTSCGWDEPHRGTKKAYFSCVIGIYLMSFFYEHPVERVHPAFLTTYLAVLVYPWRPRGKT